MNRAPEFNELVERMLGRPMSELTCKHCGLPIELETDDMITCGGIFSVWFSRHGDKKRMSCPHNDICAHEPEGRQ